MIGLDTNVIIRYVTQDEPRQAKIAERAIEQAVSRGEKLLVQPIILCELVWVLESAYGYQKNAIIPVLEQILRTARFEIVDKDIVRRALDDFKEDGADFADYLIGRANERDGVQTTLTFDKSLKGCRQFTVLRSAETVKET
jgi:predicted nucleic-acid-binding protein